MPRSRDLSWSTGARVTSVLLLIACASYPRDTSYCFTPTYPAPPYRVVRAAVRDSDPLGRTQGELLVRVSDDDHRRYPDHTQLQFIAALDRQTVVTDSSGEARVVAQGGTVYTVAAQRIGYRGVQDTVTVRAGFVDTVFLKLLPARICLDRVTAG